jgi:hypothetical protein
MERIDLGQPDLDPHRECGSGSRRAKMTYKNSKAKKLHVLKCWMFSFED